MNVDTAQLNTSMKYIRVIQQVSANAWPLQSIKLGTECSISMSCESKFTIESPNSHLQSVTLGMEHWMPISC